MAQDDVTEVEKVVTATARSAPLSFSSSAHGGDRVASRERGKLILVPTCDMCLFPPSLIGAWRDLFVSRGVKQTNLDTTSYDLPQRGFRGSSCITAFLTSSCLLRSFAYVDGMAAKFVPRLTLTAEDIADSEQLEPAFESILRSLKVHDSVVAAMRVNEVTDRALFTDLAQDESKLKHCGKAFGIDTSEGTEFSLQRQMAKLMGAWRQAKTQYEVKTAADAAAKAHGEPVTVLAMDWNSLMVKFRQTYGADLCENELLA